jgi:hypothetical protein
VTLEEFFAIVEKARKEASPEAMKQQMKLYVDNAMSVAKSQSGEWGGSVALDTFYFSGNTIHVGGW